MLWYKSHLLVTGKYATADLNFTGQKMGCSLQRKILNITELFFNPHFIRSSRHEDIKRQDETLSRHEDIKGQDETSSWHRSIKEQDETSSWHGGIKGQDETSSWHGGIKGQDETSSWHGVIMRQDKSVILARRYERAR